MMEIFRTFASAQEARDYRHEHGTAGWIFEGDDGLVILFPQNYMPSGILILFPEAFATGGCMTLAVVYRPAWVVSFDDRRYLHGR